MPHRPHDHDKSVIARVAWLTVSDTRTEATNKSGAAAAEMILEAGHVVIDTRILPDEPDQVASQVTDWLSDSDCQAVIVSGGTGISNRDRTYEALIGLLDKRLDGFGELFRALSHEEIGSSAMLTRAVAGIARGKPIFSIPGSTPAVRLALTRLILPELPHLLAELSK